MKTNKFTNFIAVITLTLLMGMTALSQTTLVTWNFPNNPDNATADGGIAANAARTITTVGSNAPTFNVAGFDTNAATANGWNSGSGTKYWTVSFSTIGYNSIQFSSKQRSSDTGPRDFKVQYSLNNATWTDVAGATTTVPNNWNVVSTGYLTDINLPAAVSNQPNVYLRWIMTSNISSDGGTVAAGGTSRMDDIVITALAPLAGDVFVGGRVMSERGFPIGNALVTISGGPLVQPRTFRTSGFGYFGFRNVAVGSTYLITVTKDGYTFDQPSRIITLSDEETGVVFTGGRNFGRR